MIYDFRTAHQALCCMQVADLNGDSRLDIIDVFYPLFIKFPESNASGTVQILTNNDNGTFTLQNIFYFYKFKPNSLVFTDVDGNNHSDIIIGGYETSKIIILFNNGQNNFTQETIDLYNKSKLKFITIKDLNKDNKPDMIAEISNPRGISILLQNGNGTFTEPIDYPIPCSHFSTITTADLYSKNETNLIVACRLERMIIIFENHNDKSFLTNTTIHLDYNPRFLVAVDVNNDHQLDIIITDDNDRKRIVTYLNVDQKKFINPINITIQTNYNTIESVAVVDINCDGKNDLVFIRNDQIQLLFNIGNGEFSEPLIFETQTFLFILLMKDMNNDNQIDLVLGYSFDIRIWYIQCSAL